MLTCFDSSKCSLLADLSHALGNQYLTLLLGTALLDGCVARAVYSICYTVFLLSEEEVVQGSTKYES